MTWKGLLYIASLDGNARTFAFAVRGHWGIEDSVHWLLDLVFRKDECRISVGKGPKTWRCCAILP